MLRTNVLALVPMVAVGLAGPASAVEPQAVLKTYADIAAAGFSDALTTARTLEGAIASFLAAPDESTLQKARDAWRAARVPYMQTEVFRFGNPVVDAWEGKVNAWPLDEGLIDYVAPSYGEVSDANPWYTANVVANERLTIAGQTVDATVIDADLLRSLQEIGGVEANVATGYHAIEFLLWGQDLNGTGPGAGDRPATDYALDGCTHDHCDRRRVYLKAATDLLVDDLKEMADSWAKGGEARDTILNGEPWQGLVAAFTGMGSLAYGELAGERTKLGLLLHDPEEEQDCFSDNTHNAHYYDVVGMRNVYLGTYTSPDGTKVEGPSLSDLVRAKSGEADQQLEAALDRSLAAAAAIKEAADSGRMHYDEMLGEGNEAGNTLLQTLVTALVDQAHATEDAVRALGLQDVAFEGSDSLDDPDAAVR